MNKDLPLKNITVLDLTNVLSGPFATQILSDLGAQVIKVEKPEGDDSRKFGPFVEGKSSYFISLNRGKKSISLNLKKNKDKIIFEKLITKSDVLIENFRPGTMEKLGYTSKYLKKKFPGLVQAKISGFGETGPLKSQPAYDIIVQAMSGIMSITGSDKNNFCRVGTSIGDIVAGLYAVIGILTQLIYRDQTNKGSRLDLSMLDCQVAILENAVARYSVEKTPPSPLGTDHPSITPFGAFKTKDGSIAIAAGNDKLFFQLCEAIGEKFLTKNKLFSNNENRNKNLSTLRPLIEKKLMTKKTSYWQKKLTLQKIPNSKVNNIHEAIENSQIRNRKMILNYKDRKVRKLLISGNPLNFSFSKKTKISKKSPDLNEHKEDIIKFLKLS